jgi:glycolate oxidase FAD binding subunit
VPVGEVARATTTGELAAVMRTAAVDGARVVVRGRATKLDWGAPPEGVDVLVDVSAMDGVIEHAAGDLVVHVQAGVTLAALSERLAPAGQRLVLGEVVPGSTVGGVMATALSGPLRLGYAAVRDLVLGVTVVAADGTVAKGGGKVVKNVAGYDLAKLFTGSYGTLGVIAEAVLRLHPLPEAAAWVTATYPDFGAAAAPAAAVLGSQLVPAAVELDRPAAGAGVTMCVTVEGSRAGVVGRGERVGALMGPGAQVTGEAPAWWGTLPAHTVIKVTAELASVAAVGDALPGAVRASAGSGILYQAVAAGTAAEDLGRLVARARRLAADAGGFAVVLGAPAPMKEGVDVWGPAPGVELMRRIKAVFDPDRRLAPGRFVGGI